jgi:tRNA G26 N,N-dimethylase Trm1
MAEAAAAGASGAASRGGGAVPIEVAPRTARLIDRLAEEATGPPLFRVVTKYAHRARGPPRMDELVAALTAAGHRACRTHFDPFGVRTNASPEDIRRAVAEIDERGENERRRKREPKEADE